MIYTIPEIVKLRPGNQFVLCYPGLCPVVFGPGDLSADATFYRRSRHRLIQGFRNVYHGTLPSGGDGAPGQVVWVWKTDRHPLKDYVLYESSSHEHIRAWITHRAKQHSRQRCTVRKYPLACNPCLEINMAWDNGVMLEFVYNGSRYAKGPIPNPYNCHWTLAATVYALMIAHGGPGGCARVVLNYPIRHCRDIAYNLAAHRWQPFPCNAAYVRTMDKLKDESYKDIDIVFK